MNKETIKQVFKEHWLFLCILVLAIGLRLLYPSPGIRFSGADLSLQAYNLINGLYNPNKIWFHFGIRYTMLLLVSLVYKIFGISEFSAFFVPFLSSLTTIVLIYLFGRTFFSKEVGLLAAYFLAILPLDIHNATILETDGTMNVFAVLAMFLYYYFRVRQKNTWLFLFVGMLIAISALTKIFGVLVLFSLLLYEIITLFSNNKTENAETISPKMRITSAFFRLLTLGIGFALVYTPVLVWQYAETGDPFYNIHIEKNLLFSLPNIRDWPKPDYDFIPKSNDHWSFPRFMFNPILSLSFFTEYYVPDEENPMLNIFFYFVFAAIFYVLYKGLYKSKPILLFFLCWFFVPLLFLQSYSFIWKVQRYLFIILVPAFLLAASFLFTLYSSEKVSSFLLKPSRFFGSDKKEICIAFFFLFLLAISLYQMGRYTFFNTPYRITINNQEVLTHTYEETMYFLIKDVAADKDIYVTNYHTIPILNFYFGYSKNYSGPHGYTGPTTTSFYDLHFVKNWSTIYDAYVILEPNYFLKDIDEYSYYRYYNVSYRNINPEALVITSHWQLVFGRLGDPFLIYYAYPMLS